MIIYDRYQKLLVFFARRSFGAHCHTAPIALTKAIIMKTLVMTTMMASHLDGAVLIQIVGKREGLASLVITGYDRKQIDDYKETEISCSIKS